MYTVLLHQAEFAELPTSTGPGYEKDEPQGIARALAVSALLATTHFIAMNHLVHRSREGSVPMSMPHDVDAGETVFFLFEWQNF